MTAHIEVLHALLKPSKDFAAVLAIFQSHAQAVAAAQSADGRWHQVMTNSSSWLETSATGEMGTHQSSIALVWCARFSRWQQWL
jgi:rhamnogalacturonyl hydrolase YesR